MSEVIRSRIFTLAKVMIAAAWADGEIAEEEKQCLKDLLFHLPDAGLDAGIQMTAQEWDQLEIYLEKPIEEAERARLIDDLQAAIKHKEEKQIVISYLEQLASADGEMTAEERAVIDEIETAINDADTGVMRKLNRFLGGAVNRRSTAVAKAPNREKYFDDFVKNKIYYEMKQLAEQSGQTFDLSDAELRKLGLAGGLMARIAYVDRAVTADEVQTMADLIAAHWGLGADTAVFVANIAVNSVDYSYDYYRMTREFGTSTTYDERVRFLDLLFNVAVADGRVTFEETEEIRLVSRGINLAHDDFIKAKLKIPRDKRD